MPLGLLAVMAMAQETRVITEVGTLGGTQSFAHAVNDAGQVVGRSLLRGDARAYFPFLWSAATGIEDLGAIGGGQNQGSANAINVHGQVVGRSWSNVGPGGYAFSWTRAGGMVRLPTLVEGSCDCSEATGINDHGDIVGFSYTPGLVSIEAVMWPLAGGVVSLGVIGSPINRNSRANDINNHGVVVGRATAPGSSGNSFHRPFRWTADAGMEDLGSLGGLNGEARAINDAEQIVGWSEIPDRGAHRAFSWTPSGGLTALPMLPDHWWSEAYSVNDAGVVVGWSFDNTGVRFIVMWAGDGSVVALPEIGYEVRGINNLSQIVGARSVNSLLRATLLGPAAALTRTLTVMSTSPALDVPVAVTPIDNSGNGGGQTPFLRTFYPTVPITLTAPSSVGAHAFVKWRHNDVDVSTTPTLQLTMNDAQLVHTVRAVYQAIAVGAPTNLRVVAATGNTVTLEWDHGVGTQAPTSHVLEGGLTPGAVIGSIHLAGSATRATLELPTGAFYLRLYARAGTTSSEASNEIFVHVNTPAPPSAPRFLRGVANGTALHLEWQNTAGGGVPQQILLEVGGSQTLTLPLGLVDSFSHAAVPAGRYTFSVRAANASGVSEASNQVMLSFPGTCTEAPPTGLSVVRQGRVVSVSWVVPVGSVRPFGYRVDVSGSASLQIATREPFLTGSVPPGNYTVSVYSVGPCGRSTSTPIQTVVVP